MLESPSLLISLEPEPARAEGGWQGKKPAGARGTRLLIRAPASGEPLGLACFGREERLLWRFLPAAQILAVHEYLDEPLLFTARRTWPLPGWLVRDADGRPVGSLLGCRLQDRRGRRLIGQALGQGQGWDFRDASGRTFARLHVRDKGLQLEFAPAAEHEPFLKMLLLAFALTRPPVPSARPPGRG
jgi:hypothetical protein